MIYVRRALHTLSKLYSKQFLYSLENIRSHIYAQQIRDQFSEFSNETHLATSNEIRHFLKTFISHSRKSKKNSIFHFNMYHDPLVLAIYKIYDIISTRSLMTSSNQKRTNLIRMLICMTM